MQKLNLVRATNSNISRRHLITSNEIRTVYKEEDNDPEQCSDQSAYPPRGRALRKHYQQPLSRVLPFQKLECTMHVFAVERRLGAAELRYASDATDKKGSVHAGHKRRHWLGWRFSRAAGRRWLPDGGGNWRCDNGWTRPNHVTRQMNARKLSTGPITSSYQWPIPTEPPRALHACPTRSPLEANHLTGSI